LYLLFLLIFFCLFKGLSGADKPPSVSCKSRFNMTVSCVDILLSDVQISTEDIPGWLVSSEGGLTVALDINIDAELRAEGLSRELVNRVQNLRKDIGLEVTDRISLAISSDDEIRVQLQQNLYYIRTQTLAEEVNWNNESDAVEIELEEGVNVLVKVVKL